MPDSSANVCQGTNEWKRTREREFHYKQQDADRILLLHVDKTANLSKIQIDMVHFFAANWSFFSPQHNIILQKIWKMFSCLRINSLTRRSLVICSSVASPRVEYLTRLLGDGYPAEERCKQKIIKTPCQRSSPMFSSCSNLW